MILVNSIYAPVKEFNEEVPFTGPHRIIGIDRYAGIVALFNLDGNSNAPFNMSLDVIEHLVAENKLQPANLLQPGYMLKTELSEQDQKIFEARKILISPFLDNEDTRWFFDADIRGKLITQQMIKYNRPRKAVLRWLYTYLKYGMFLGALYPGFSRRGGRGKRKSAGNKKRGRRKNTVITGHDVSQTGINITEGVRKIFLAFKDIYYNKKDGRGLTYVLKKVIEAFYSVVEINEKGEKKHIVQPNAPSQRQFNYWHREDGNVIKEKQLREGSRRFNLKSRGLGGRAGENCNSPTDKYELDSTVLDLYCLSSFNPAWIIGRPILYFVVDTYSRMIVGFHLALRGPNWDEARIALFNSFTDKVALCARAGIKISSDDWPCCYLPQTVLVDRAEMRAHKPQGIIEGLSIDIDLAPPFRGDFKSIVERRFRILNDVVIKWIPGAVLARFKERGERDYQLDAKLTLQDVQKVIIRCILDHNNKMEFPDLLTTEMIRDGVIPTPQNMWNWGLENAMGSPRKENVRNVFCHLANKGMASVREDGIWWNNIRYTCETELSDNWRAKARNFGRWKVPIRWLPDPTDHIWIFDEHSGSFEQCDILSPEEKFKGFRVDECIDATAFLRLEKNDRNPSRLGSEIDSNRYYEDLIAAASSRLPNITGLSKQDQVGNINLNKALEQILLSHPGLKNNPHLLKHITSTATNLLDESDVERRNEIANLYSRILTETSN